MTEKETVKVNTKSKTETADFLDYLESAAFSSLIDEVSATPKPGLVDKNDSGAHSDMDFSTFTASTDAIVPFIRQMAAIGISWREPDNLEGLFFSIRTAGIAAEASMFQATGGVNTHKGIIFSMGIAAAASGYHFALPKPPLSHLKAEELLLTCRQMCSRAMERDFAAIRPDAPKTHGESLYLKYGCRGIRGEAADGFPAVSGVGLPAIRQILNEFPHMAACLDGPFDLQRNRLCLHVLLKLMAEVDDTNVLFRTDEASLHYVKEKAASVLQLGGAFSGEGMTALEEMNRDFIRRNISPGGCADLLSLSLFFWRLEQFSI